MIISFRDRDTEDLVRARTVRDGQQSIRINDRYRCCFRWTTAGPEDVEIVDYHH